MFGKIAVAYDGSENSKRALDVAVELAKRFGSTLNVVEVIDVATLSALELGSEAVIDAMRARADSDVKAAVERAVGAGVGSSGAVLIGDPVRMVLEHAEESGVELIVTGSRGLSTLKRILLGSVSSGLVAGSKVPVLVVK